MLKMDLKRTKTHKKLHFCVCNFNVVSFLFRDNFCRDQLRGSKYWNSSAWSNVSRISVRTINMQKKIQLHNTNFTSHVTSCN